MRGAEGLVDGEASVANEEPWRDGQGGDEVLASNGDGARGTNSA